MLEIVYELTRHGVLGSWGGIQKKESQGLVGCFRVSKGEGEVGERPPIVSAAVRNTWLQGIKNLSARYRRPGLHLAAMIHR